MLNPWQYTYNIILYVLQNYPGKASQILGGLQVAVGILLIIFNIAAIVIHAHAANGGTGIWTGIFVSLQLCRANVKKS